MVPNHGADTRKSIMKVGINATWLATQTGGIKTYVRNLVRCLPSVDPGTRYVMYSRELLDDGMLPAGSRMPRLHVDPGSRIARVPSPPRWRWPARASTSYTSRSWRRLCSPHASSSPCMTRYTNTTPIFTRRPSCNVCAR